MMRAGTKVGYAILAVAAVLTVALLWLAGAGRAQEAELPIPEATQACITCHVEQNITPSAIRDWQLSKHFPVVGCQVCHIPSEDAPEAVRNAESTCKDTNVRAAVSPANCTPCHADQAEQFAQGKHALAWVAMNAMPATAMQPDVIMEGEKGCGGCHRIGRDEGKCDSCHTRHTFSAAEARKPQACQTCHMGFDHPQWEMYSTSKHGTIYATEGHKWNFDKKLSEWYADPYAADPTIPRAPVCATCHMPDGDHAVRTAWGFLALRLPEPDDEWMGYRAKILQGLGVLDQEGNPTNRLETVQIGKVARLTAEEWQAERDRMIAVCSKCHAPTWARDNLARADQVIKESDKLMAAAVDIVQGLYNDGILPRPTDYAPHVDLLRFYDVQHPIEQILYVMFLEHRMRSFQGAFHMNPDYMHWYGWAELKKDLNEIETMAKELRAQKGEG
ncbi:MAG: multiheme c-type cytochrome [Armatimonadota bacterium]